MPPSAAIDPLAAACGSGLSFDKLFVFKLFAEPLRKTRCVAVAFVMICHGIVICTLLLDLEQNRNIGDAPSVDRSKQLVGSLSAAN